LTLTANIRLVAVSVPLCDVHCSTWGTLSSSVQFTKSQSLCRRT